MGRQRLPSRIHLLSVRRVQTACAGDHADGGGLVLRVTASAASWVFRYTAPSGKRREMGLGGALRNNSAVAGNSLTDARSLAQDARTKLQRGLDPIDERDRLRTERKATASAHKLAEAAEKLTLARAARAYHERVIEPNRSTKHSNDWINSLEQHIPANLWHKPLAEVEAPELLDVMVELFGKVPETASRIRQRLEAVFEDGVFRGQCSSNPAHAIRRKLREVVRARERSHYAALEYKAVPMFVRRLRAQPGTAARALEFALLTAARTNEVVGLTWTEIDERAAMWRVPAERMKADEEHIVYLSARALAIVEEMRWLNAANVFPSPRDQDKPLSNMAMLTLLRRMGVADQTTVHGLCRATFSTWAYENAIARAEVIEACLAHREADRVKAAYNRAKFAAERRQLLHAWADYCCGTAEASNVSEYSQREAA